MCYTAFFVNNKKDRIKTILLEKRKFNSDGMSYLLANQKSMITGYHRTIEKNENYINQADVSKMGIIHYRLATAGTINVNNCHLWRYNHWYFSHNGIVQQLVKNKELSDSHLFFRLLVKKINTMQSNKDIAKRLKSAIKKYNLNGRGFLIQEYQGRIKRVFIFGDMNIYKIKETLLISSASVNLLLKKDYLGLSFLTEQRPLEGKIDGVWVFENGYFYQLLEKINNYSYYYDDFYNNNYYLTKNYD